MKRYCLFLIALLAVLSSCATPNNCMVGDSYYNKDVNAAIYKLCTANGINPSDIQYCVVGGQDVNAQMGIGGILSITMGTIDLARNTDRELLACVIAHELSHYALNHLTKHNAISIGTTAAFVVAGAFIPGVGLLNHVVNPTVCKAYGRSNELDADVNAVKMCNNAGFFQGPEPYLRMLETLSSLYPNQGGSLWATHPSWDDRIEAVKSAYPQ